jgi:hypothetical protein
MVTGELGRQIYPQGPGWQGMAVSRPMFYKEMSKWQLSEWQAKRRAGDRKIGYALSLPRAFEG